MNIMPEYPEIVEELIEQTKAGKLRYFELSSFVSGPSLNSSYLVGNFNMDRKESEGILKGVGRIDRKRG